VVQAEKYSTERTTINFKLIKPGKYLLRVIYDQNENEIWDTGSFLGRLQAEEVLYFPETLEVRANWDINEVFDLAN